MPYRKIALTSLILLLIGVGGLLYIFHQTLPTLGPRWLFFFFFLTAVSGLVLPVTAFLNQRFSGGMPVEPHVVIRQAVLCGVCADLLAWMQLGRELTLTTGLIIVAGFALIEILLRVGERSRWKPKETDE